MKWFIKCMRNYANFEGRAQRAEYWFFLLFGVLIGFLVNIVSGLVGNFPDKDGGDIVGTIYFLFMLLPSMSVAARRFHDIGKNGWNVIWLLIPFVNLVFALVFLTRKSESGENAYGPNPLGEQLTDNQQS